MHRTAVITNPESSDTSQNNSKTRHAVIPESTIRRVSSQRFGVIALLGIVIRQAVSEAWIRVFKHINFRRNDNKQAVSAYSFMSVGEFEAINARQKWANWRTIPRNLSGHVPQRPVFALDLCCGVGHSTEVLSWYLPVGSEILGLEYSPSFVERAQKKTFTNSDGRPASVRFRAQSVLETFCDPSGTKLSDESVDLVSCSGAVGCHFDVSATTLLAREVARVLKAGGIAMIDSGPAGTSPEELTRIFESLGMTRIGAARSCIVDPYTQVVFRKA